MAVNQDRNAVLRGIKAATKLHRDLGTRVALKQSTRVDVFHAIARSGAVLMFKPLDPLLGAFMNEDGMMGVLITLQRPVGVQRFTAAHELGHLIMGHEPHADDNNILRRGPLAGKYSNVPIQEREADAFASHFLLPKFALSKLHNQQDWRPRSYENPHVIYQASLRLGASYDATVYALERDRVITKSLRQELLRIKPRNLKADLVDGHKIDGWMNRDVWRLTERDEGLVIEANRSDLFVLKLKEHSGSGYLWTFDELNDAGFVVLKDEAEAMFPGRIGGPRKRYVLGDPQSMAEGSYTLKETRPWNPDEDSNSVTFHYRHSVSREDGQYSPQLDKLIRAN